MYSLVATVLDATAAQGPFGRADVRVLPGLADVPAAHVKHLSRDGDRALVWVPAATNLAAHIRVLDTRSGASDLRQPDGTDRRARLHRCPPDGRRTDADLRRSRSSGLRSDCPSPRAGFVCRAHPVLGAPRARALGGQRQRTGRGLRGTTPSRGYRPGPGRRRVAAVRHGACASSSTSTRVSGPVSLSGDGRYLHIPERPSDAAAAACARRRRRRHGDRDMPAQSQQGRL